MGARLAVIVWKCPKKVRISQKEDSLNLEEEVLDLHNIKQTCVCLTYIISLHRLTHTVRTNLNCSVDAPCLFRIQKYTLVTLVQIPTLLKILSESNYFSVRFIPTFIYTSLVGLKKCYWGWA